MPSAWRTGLRQPSQATMYSACTVRSSPLSVSRRVAVTPSSDCSKLASSVP